MRLSFRVLVGAVLYLAVSGCQGLTRAAEAPSPDAHSEWAASLTQTWQELGAGRYAVADRLLAEYQSRYPASIDAIEAMYWRAIYRLDPANPAASTHEAIALLDAYLASSQTPHRTESQILRRIAVALDARPKEVAASNSNTAPTTAPKDDKAQADEITRLKDELAKANAELERIKRRLAQPKP